jgi:hypothetical protein
MACSWLLEDVKVDVCVRVYCILAQLQREVTFSVSKPDDLFQMQPRTQNHVYKTSTTVTGLFSTAMYVNPYRFRVQFWRQFRNNLSLLSLLTRLNWQRTEIIFCSEIIIRINAVNVLNYKGSSSGRGIWQLCRGKEMPPGNWWGNLKKINKVEDLVLDGRIILKRIFRK